MEAWSCGYCLHAWRPEPWGTSSQEEFFSNASYTKAEDAEEIYHVKQNIFGEFLRQANIIKPLRPRLMVDFGCAYGDLMQTFKKAEWNVMGIEISASSQKILADKQLPWAACLEDSRLAPGSVDIIVMSDCICYLPNPIEVLIEIRQYSNSNGYLFLRQPTRGGLLRLLSKVSNKGKAFESLGCDHMHVFSRKSTAIALNKAGFSDVIFHKEKGYNRTLKNEMVHRVLRAMDLLSVGFLDLTLSWMVVAKAAK